ncbi:MAG: hypothetical protein HW397_148 [Dehalococcoidia bacterium]|nr:hypothetical protein [Dehalococcoidia bacterium]
MRITLEAAARLFAASGHTRRLGLTKLLTIMKFFTIIRHASLSAPRWGKFKEHSVIARGSSKLIAGISLAMVAMLAAACAGPAGPDGARGPAGPTGPAGPAGAAAPTAATGVVAPGVALSPASVVQGRALSLAIWGFKPGEAWVAFMSLGKDKPDAVLSGGEANAQGVSGRIGLTAAAEAVNLIPACAYPVPPATAVAGSGLQPFCSVPPGFYLVTVEGSEGTRAYTTLEVVVAPTPTPRPSPTAVPPTATPRPA